MILRCRLSAPWVLFLFRIILPSLLYRTLQRLFAIVLYQITKRFVMKRICLKCSVIVIGMVISVTSISGQEQVNTADRMMQEEDRLTLGGYAQIDYNQPVKGGTYSSGGLDVHRMVLMFGYKFNEKTQFVTEVEFEHVKEVYVEQAFLQYEILPWLKFRGGLMLIPMGIINEFHEPSTFNGVERPNLDKYIVPTTWREIGAGFTGVFPSAALSYQVYLTNGFKSYDDGATLTGSSGFRSGRQKGAESIINAPNLAFKVNYFGIAGLQVGFSGYTGLTQSSLFDGIEKTDVSAVSLADSSVVGLTMIGADVRYSLGGLQIRGQLNYGWVSNAGAYNDFTGSDLGSAISGWYGEVAYNVLKPFDRFKTELIPFIRYEQYNTHASVEDGITPNPAFDRTDLTMGLGWKIANGAMLKLDYQLFKDNGPGDSGHQVNAGVAVWF